ncbi:hypothetical protein ACFX2A_027164 [Malus domestica]
MIAEVQMHSGLYPSFATHISGTIFLDTVEKLSLVDAFYCVYSTIITLGYGDKSFSTQACGIWRQLILMTRKVMLLCGRKLMLEYLEPLFVNKCDVHRYERFFPLENYTCGNVGPIHVMET